MEILLTLTGIDHYIDPEELEPNQEVILRKEPSNKKDKEAIAIYIKDTVKIGYVANSVYSVAKGTYSAGRLYDKVENEAKAVIQVILRNSAIMVISIENKKA